MLIFCLIILCYVSFGIVSSGKNRAHDVLPEDFLNIISEQENPLVIEGTGGFWRMHHRYLTSYKGLIFFTKSPLRLQIPESAEVIKSERFFIPDIW